MTNEKIQEIRAIAYNKYKAGGASAVYEYAKGSEYSHCKCCEVDTPTLIDEYDKPECLVCGNAK